MATRKGAKATKAKRELIHVETVAVNRSASAANRSATRVTGSMSRAMQAGGPARKDTPKIAPKANLKATTKASKNSLVPIGAAEVTAPVLPIAQLPLSFAVVHRTKSASLAQTARITKSREPLPSSIPAEEEDATTPTDELPLPAQMTVRRKFGELRAAIADGFEIQEPVYARPLWSAPDNSRVAYSFVLQRESSTRLITVPGGRTVQQFIRERDLQVDYRQ